MPNTAPLENEDEMKVRPEYCRERSRSPMKEKRQRSRERNRDRDEENKGNRFLTRIKNEEVEEGGIYRAKIVKIVDFGAFASLVDFRGRKEGLIHISQLSKSRVSRVDEVVKRDQFVFVKVLTIIGSKLALSMKEVDQESGEDLKPKRNDDFKTDNFLENSDRPAFEVSSVSNARFSRGVKKIASPERWELNQLRNSGLMTVREDPTFGDDQNAAAFEDTEEQKDVELNEEQPEFLKGLANFQQTHSPVRVVKDPDGSLHRAATSQSQLAKERKEMRDQQAKEELDALPQDIGRSWEDPLADPADRYLAAELKTIGRAAAYTVPEWKQETQGKNVSFGKVSRGTIKEQRESLPIFKFRDDFLRAVNEHDMLVVIGETGSGKTTQMTQYLAEAGYSKAGKIGCTQPRRVAAMSIAKRVAEEFGCRLGQEVGYCIRFEDLTSQATIIKYCTDGMLLRECLIDPDLKSYSVVILDEAHERTINTDILFGLLKKVLLRRREAGQSFKLIVTSATLEAKKFASYFGDCPILSIPGRTFEVAIMYSRAPEQDYLDAALITVLQIHLSEPPGDILLFLTGKEEIDSACQVLFERIKALGKHAPPLMVLPVYSALPSELQTKIFEPAPMGTRKCVVATNIAEASLTIDGIYYVVDPGFVKQKVFDPKLGMDSLQVTPISQASAKQRAGRAGRTGPGKCFRLFTEHAYKTEMLEMSVPEIQRTNLANTVLTLKALGINDLMNFGFMDPPPPQTLVAALQQLYTLGALDEEGLLTRIGRKMAEFPLEPQLSKMLICSVELGCAEEILTIVAMLSVEQIFFRPRDKQAIADQKKAKFFAPEGDHITLLNVYNGWRDSKYSNSWCSDNYIQSRSLLRAQDVRKQLLTIMDRYKLQILSAGRDYVRVCKAIVSGFFTHAAKKDVADGYKTVTESTPVYLHPSSALFNRQPGWIIYHSLIMTTREYMHECLALEPKWLTELAPRFFRNADPKKISKLKQAERIEPLFDRHREAGSWRLSKKMG